MVTKSKKLPALPSMPAVAAQLLEAYADPDRPLDRIVAIIKMDPAITMKVFKYANSPMYCRGRVDTLEQAVLWLGRHTLTCLVLSFSLSEEAQRQGPYTRFYQEYWLQSVIQAIAMKLLVSRRNPAQGDAAFVIGLLMDIGRLAMLKDDPEWYAALRASLYAGQQPVRELELASVAKTHGAISAQLLDACGFPESTVRTARLHDVDIDRLLEEEGQEHFERVAAANVASAAADFLAGIHSAESLRKLNKLCTTIFGMSHEEIDRFLEDIRSRLAETSEMFNTDPKILPPPTELLAGAMEQIVWMSLAPSGGEPRGDREAPLSDENAELRSRIRELENKTCLDKLTLLYDRNYFEQRLQQRLETAAGQPRHVAVLFLDLNNFKQINDTHGHLAGDDALRAVGEVLRRIARSNDVAARFGGDEFVILLNDSDEAVVRCVSERICASLAQTAVELQDGQQLQIAASVGAAIQDIAPTDVASCAKRLIAAADGAMYEAKRRGDNSPEIRRLSQEFSCQPKCAAR